MSRRMDREGLNRADPQGIKNRRFWDDPRCVEDAKGWVQPFTVWQGWDEFNHAAYALRCILIWRDLPKIPGSPVFREDGTINREELHKSMTGARIESDLRSFRFHIARSHRCDRPAIP